VNRISNRNNDNIEQIALGSQVYIVERDERKNVCEVSGYMLLAYTENAVIVSAFINGSRNLEGIIEYHIEKTAWAFNTDLCVFPLIDCYKTKEDADSALEKELNE